MLDLRLIRAARKYTQEQLAEEVGIARATVIHIEKGTAEPSPTNAQAIADVLGFVNWYDFYTDVTKVQWKGEAPI